MVQGKYIVIEGTDGTGKSTQAELIAERLNRQGIDSIQFHEPDGVKIAGEIRTILKNGSLDRTALTNVLLFTSSRRENWIQEGLPALKAGKWVISARDYTSTLVYQGIAENLELGNTIDEDLAIIEQLTLMATDRRYVTPDHRIILDINDEAERVRRIEERGELKNPDTWESKDYLFQQSLIQGYRRIAGEKNLPIISASQSIEAINDQIWDIITSHDTTLS